MTPSDIEVLLHCHIAAQAHPRSEAPAVKDAIEWFLWHNIIQKTARHGCYTTTLKGQKLVQMLCDTPLPVRSEGWLDPREQT